MSKLRRQTIYLSEQHWGQIIARAWQDETFKDWLETDPVAAIRAEFDFEFLLISTMPNRPDGITDKELEKIVNGDIFVIPDRFERV